MAPQKSLSRPYKWFGALMEWAAFMAIVVAVTVLAEKALILAALMTGMGLLAVWGEAGTITARQTSRKGMRGFAEYRSEAADGLDSYTSRFEQQISRVSS